MLSQISPKFWTKVDKVCLLLMLLRDKGSNLLTIVLGVVVIVSLLHFLVRRGLCRHYTKSSIDVHMVAERGKRPSDEGKTHQL